MWENPLVSPNICCYILTYPWKKSRLRRSTLFFIPWLSALHWSHPLPPTPPCVASICNSETTSVHSGVSIPISDRHIGRAQVVSPTCRKWRMSSMPHWSGRSCLIPIAAPAGNPAVWPWSLIPIHSEVLGKSCGSQRGLSSVHHLQHLPWRNIQFIL